MEQISDNTPTQLTSAKRPRRRHSPAFKTEVLAACHKPGASVAAVAQRYHLNANLIHKWRKAIGDEGHALTPSPGFVSIPLNPVAASTRDAQVTFSLGQLTIQWPLSHINESLPWLKALQS